MAFVDFPKLPDYPAHFAAFYLIGGGANDPLLKHVYRIVWSPIPNLAAELAAPALAHLVSLATAARLFLGVSIVLWVLGPALIHRALFGRFGLGAVIAAAFAYNVNLMWGFLNYYFGAGLAFLVFAAWIATSRRRTPVHLLLFALAALVLYFCHIFAAVVLLFMLAFFEAGAAFIGRQLRWQALGARLASVFGVFSPVAIAFLFKPKGEGDSHIDFNLIDTMLDRLDAMLQRYFDRPAYVFLAVLLVALGAALYFERAAINRQMRVLLGALLVASLFAPEWAMGGWGIDLRLPPILCSLLFASVEMRLSRSSLALLCTAILMAFIGCSAGLAMNWHEYDRRMTEFRASLTQVPFGASLMTVLDGSAIGKRSDQPYWHMAELAIVDRQAFTPLMFTTRGQHVTRLLPPYTKFAAASANQGSPPDITELEDLANGVSDDDLDIQLVFPYLMYFQCHFDEAVVIHLNGKRSPIPLMLHLRHEGSFFSLYDIDRSTCPKR
ncbi:MAG TPA: hypothetical protein VEH07_01415 [Alphaproteobacteria bacterium]|nr:hypothetical protein [Alphaproteobacteria bacterium]